ncbi:MAG: mobilization protein [Gammaproteobacteria bacterium]|nr:mobilization protein [Gammaproteobacteria bacterium]
MSKIHFIGGEKGGVGKSVTARLLAQYLIDHNTPFRIYDADLSHGAMMRYYGDYTQPLDISDAESADRFAEEVITSGTTAIVDLAAQTLAPLSHWIEETGLIDLAAESDLTLTLWHILDDGADSLMLLQKMFHTFGEQPNYVIVRNFGRGSDFSAYTASEAAALAERCRATVIDLPPLNPGVMRKIDHYSASFWAAANLNGQDAENHLGLLERQRVKIWLNKIYKQFAEVI